MAKGIEIGIASETRAFKQGVETGMIKPLENAVEALDDLGKSKGPDQLEAGLKDAQTATGKLQKETKQTAETIEREYRDAYRKSKTASKDGTDKMSENVGEFKNEAISNLSEVASSFKGDLSDMADGVQGLTGGLAASLTPGIGIPVAILGAVAAAFFASWQQAAEDSEERVSSMYQAFLESGSKYLSDEQMSQAISDLADDTGKWQEALQLAQDTQLPIQTVLRALVGDQEALNEGIQAENDAHDRSLTAINENTLAMEDKAAAILVENKRHDDTIGKLKQIQADTDTAATKAAAVTAAFGTGNAALDQQIARVQTLAENIRGLSNIPVTMQIRADTTGLDGILARYQGRNITVNNDGQIVKIGQMVW